MATLDYGHNKTNRHTVVRELGIVALNAVGFQCEARKRQ